MVFAFNHTDRIFHLLFLRGLVGYRSVFSSDTRGTGFMHRAFLSKYFKLSDFVIKKNPRHCFVLRTVSVIYLFSYNF